jgi:hypothetical protein
MLSLMSKRWMLEPRRIVKMMDANKGSDLSKHLAVPMTNIHHKDISMNEAIRGNHTVISILHASI